MFSLVPNISLFLLMLPWINTQLTKDMTTQERINFYNEGGRAFLAEMEKRKRQKAVEIGTANDCRNEGQI